MLHYLATASGLSLLVLLLISRLSNAPSRYRFYVLLLGLLSWYLPWHWLKLPEQSAVLFVTMFNDALRQSVAPVVIHSQLNSGLFIFKFAAEARAYTFFAIACLLGLIFFLVDWCRHFIVLQRYYHTSTSGNFLWNQLGLTAEKCDLRILPGCNNAFTSGLFKPVIWLDDKFASIHVLQHELTHVRQYDNFFLLFLRFSQCLFWWNPLVHLLVFSARKQLELSCDERCQQINPHYSRELAELLLENSINHPPTAVLSIASSKNFNVTRLDNLRRINSMKVSFKYRLYTILTLFVAILVASIPVLSSATSENERYRVVIEQRSDSDEFLWESEVQGKELLHQLLEVSRKEAMDHTAGFSKEFDMQEHRFVVQDTATREKLLDVLKNIEALTLQRFGFSPENQQPGPALTIDLFIALNGGSQKKYSLVATEKHWTGIQHENYLVRIQPLVSENRVLVNLEVEEKKASGMKSSFAPRVLTEFGAEATIIHASDTDDTELDLRLTVNKAGN